MSIKSQIERIQSNVTASLSAVQSKGVAVPSDSTSDDLPALINSISTQGIASCAYNLLDNSDFTNPINQRGQTIYNTTGTYTLDRWLMETSDGSGMVAVGDGYIGMNASSGYVDIMQVFEHASRMTGKAYTFAVMRNGATTPEVLNFTFGTNNSMGFSDGYGGLIHYNGDRVYIRVTNTGSSWVSFLWAALYEGTYTADTLPKYIPKGYALEYLECSRYYRNFVGRFTPVTILAAGTARMTVHTTVPMRVTPTVTLLNADNIILNTSGAGKVLTVTSASVDSTEGDAIYINLGCNAGSDSLYATGSTFVTNLELDAELYLE